MMETRKGKWIEGKEPPAARQSSVTVVVEVDVFVACPMAMNRLAEIRTPAMTIATAIIR